VVNNAENTEVFIDQVRLQKLKIQKLSDRLMALENRIDQEIPNILLLQDIQRDAIQTALNNHWAQQLQERGDAIQTALNNHWAQQLQERGDAIQTALVSEMRRINEETEVRTATLISKLTNRVSALPPTEQIPPTSFAEALDHLTYSFFEDEFRGSRDLILQRQRVTRGLVEAVVPSIETWLDLGCGRGELLDVLTEAGIPCIGVDRNPSLVSECRSARHHVILADLDQIQQIEFRSTINVISMFQVIEHLPMNLLSGVLNRCSDLMPEGGLLVLEFPNICNENVMTADFWLDPTHIRPLHPLFVTFLLRNNGFQVLTTNDYPFLEGHIWDQAHPRVNQDALIIGRKI
jgi:2-polyprenyl-3-methyl-5-hydroxy-6-metoxy-1,4-benzoquinol methylase